MQICPLKSSNHLSAGEASARISTGAQGQAGKELDALLSNRFSSLWMVVCCMQEQQWNKLWQLNT